MTRIAIAWLMVVALSGIGMSTIGVSTAGACGINNRCTNNNGK